MGFEVWGLRFRVWGLEFEGYASGCIIFNLGLQFLVEGQVSRSTVYGLWCGIQGLGLRFHGLRFGMYHFGREAWRKAVEGSGSRIHGFKDWGF